MSRKKKSLTRPGEPTQMTKTGLEIPIPTRREVFDLLDRAAEQRPKPTAPPLPPDPSEP